MTDRLLPSLLIVAASTGCADLTAPSGTLSLSKPDPASTAPPSPVPTPPAPDPTPVAPAPGGEEIRASHVLLGFTGSSRSEATRTKDEARKLAENVRRRALKGEDFQALARELSDDPTAKARGGDLGKFTRERMVKPFSDAAFTLKPGDVSDVVETQFGFHVIKRTE
jgi:peptidyl-prolyl cis-trans isomerase NIMA-interacting 1